MYDIIIIGAGTAGLTAAIYGARNNHKALVLEATVPGGQIINTQEIENYPAILGISGYDYSMTLKKQATSLGAEYRRERVSSVDLSDEKKLIYTNKNTYQAKTVIIAAGAMPKKLGLKEDDEYTSKGISYCATCDGNFFRNKDVAVVGGGNTAFEDALFLSNICTKVYLIHRRQGFRAEMHSVNALKQRKNVELVLDSVVSKIMGEGKIEAIEVENVVDKSVKSINVSGLFVAIGQIPQSEMFDDNVFLKNADGYALVSEDTKTNIAGVYVAGDIREKPLRQLITAAADGATAAFMASSYLNLL